MKQAPKSTSDLDAVRRCFDAYGAEIDRWPDDKRKAYGDLAMSDEMASFRAEAEQLDSFLGAATAPSVGADLKNRIMAQYEAPPEQITLSDLFQNFFGGRRLIPAGALAGIGALGVMAGSLSANVTVAVSPEEEAYAYAYGDAVLSLSLDEEEAGQWDEG